MGKDATKTPGKGVTDHDEGRAPGKSRKSVPTGEEAGKVRPAGGTGDPETGRQVDQLKDPNPNQLR